MSTHLPSAELAAKAREAVSRVTAVATLPEVTARVLETVQDANSTPAALHHVIAQDPALMARILKVVNSPFYRLPGLVGTVDRAIVVLGLNAVKNIAISASMSRLFHSQRVGGRYTAKDLWRHCVAVGVTARALAEGMRLPLAEEAFLAGMVHDVGLLVAVELFPAELERVCAAATAEPAAATAPAADASGIGVGKRSFCDAEREFIGLDHQEAGALLAERWKFPQSCRLVAGYHHRPLEAPPESRLLVALVYAADTSCCQRGHGLPLTAAGQPLDAVVLADLGLTPALVERVSGDLDVLVASASDLLG